MNKVLVVDFSQVVTANLMVNNRISGCFDESMATQMMRTSLRSYRQQFGANTKYILALDSSTYWRQDVFPHYKMHRAAKRAKVSNVDWEEFYAIKASITEEFIQTPETHGYLTVRVEKAEADDVIGIVCKDFHDSQVVIISNDKDFKQLQVNPNVKQLNPIDRSWVFCKTPRAYLKMHILKGDRSDGIPNFLSDDDTFMVPGKRQTAIRTANLNQWIKMKKSEICVSERLTKNYERNVRLIDMNMIPSEIKDQISKCLLGRTI